MHTLINLLSAESGVQFIAAGAEIVSSSKLENSNFEEDFAYLAEARAGRSQLDVIGGFALRL